MTTICGLPSLSAMTPRTKIHFRRKVLGENCDAEVDGMKMVMVCSGAAAPMSRKTSPFSVIRTLETKYGPFTLSSARHAGAMEIEKRNRGGPIHSQAA